ncbi:flavin reductase (DIM6/NTAB) family NADH-FMN oxidoreductase RutF [Kineosphaera limosa]|uniref:Putative oxidoreductase n=1 Tax=Kineosphaera limosa NBRC 100340 TaxID=1184609 RepID=K6WXL3_9MICO|nr:flavin reductase family protein [Kineosphaera limosa]NYE00714.1 flavin reductase (DIM6/NTAB) family NADH-FMN oxidoreductase RutF [Kineosphaera limosa]GAB96802.1 putative oxidoreductase [Kineosphaera limosa NBRC 100340]
MSLLSAPTRLSAQELRRAFGAFPTGVTLVGAVIEGEPVGVLASSFTSVSLDPALVSVAFAHTSSTWPVLATRDVLGISVLSAHQGEHVARLSRPPRERFDTVTVGRGNHGELMLPGAVATFAVRPYQQVEAGDHTVAFLEVLDMRWQEDLPPLVVHRSGLHRLTT